METEINLLCSSSHDMRSLETASVDLVVTSPPYPMIAMWDDGFGDQDERIRVHLGAGEGNKAFELMHQLLDRTWSECDRVLKPGGIACINVGDATRTLDGDFRLYSNHWRILKTFLDFGGMLSCPIFSGANRPMRRTNSWAPACCPRGRT